MKKTSSLLVVLVLALCSFAAGAENVLGITDALIGYRSPVWHSDWSLIV